jgi:arabinofuranosyltransferase
MLSRRVPIDIWVAVALALLGYAMVWKTQGGSDLPFEDAAMLLRYSKHLARGQGITWNVGESPVDGATDFLYMVIVGAVHALGTPLEKAGFWVSGTCHFLLGPWLFWACRREGASLLSAAAAAAYVAIGPGLPILGGYFGTPMFALGVTVAWTFGLEFIRRPVRSVALRFALACLFFSLVRPEGVLMTAFMVLACCLTERKAAKDLIAMFALVFGTLGVGYFVWRWQYFGYPLPNPFYKKGGGRLYPGSLGHAIENVSHMAGVFVLLELLGVFVANTRARAITNLIPIVGFTSAWLLLSDEMNFGGRFQYALVPLSALGAAPIATELGRNLGVSLSLEKSNGTRLGCIVLAALCALSAALTTRAFSGGYPNYLGLREAGRVLQPYRDKGYLLATTEAGLLPLYSEWKAIDTWGLNDAHIAHTGHLPPEYLKERRPHVILLHSFSSPAHPEIAQEQLKGWSKMIETVQEFAASDNYELVAAYGRSPFDTHFYYVRRDFADAPAIAQGIRQLKYDWFGECVDWTQVGVLRINK